MYTLKKILSVTTDLIKPCFSGSSVRRHYQSGGFGISADSENTDSNCFYRRAFYYPEGPSSHWPVPSDHVCHSEFLCVLCGLSGPYDGSKDGEGYETAAV